MRSVSNKVPAAIIAAALPALAAILALLLFPQRAFPDALPHHAFIITAVSHGVSRDDAMRQLKEPNQRAIAFLRTNGFAPESISVYQPTYEQHPAYATGDRTETWEARQQIDVRSESYSESARLSNRLQIFQGNRTDLQWDYPEIPFETLLIAVGVATILCLTFSVISLETRSADVTHAPRGMHPVIVFMQTLTLSLLIVSSIAASHLITLLTGRVLLTLWAIGVISICVWLYKTRPLWSQSRFLFGAYRFYLIALVIAIAIGPWASRISPI